MDRILEIALWAIVATVGLVLWVVFAELRTILACFLTGTLIHRVFVASVKITARRLVGDQLAELRSEMNAIAERLGHNDRKTNALLMNALAQRELTGLRKVIGSPVSDRPHAVH
jgi:hypothetical protein